MSDKFIPMNDKMFLLSEEYLTKRMSIKLVSGEIITGFVGWPGEDDRVEETNIENDFEFHLRNVEVNGVKLGHDLYIPESQIVGYCPLEPPNTDEELRKLLEG